MERLFELLREDAPLPPSEVDVDKAVRAGRRRVRGRWVGAAAFVVVVLSVVSVIAAIGGRSVETAAPPVADFDPLVRVVTIDESVASIRGYDTARRFQHVLLWTRTGEHGWLTVYARGRQPADRFGAVRPETGTKAEPVNGRPAYWVNWQGQMLFAWQWADGAWAVFDVDDDSSHSPDQEAVRRIATAVRVTARERVTMPFTMPRPAHDKLVGTSSGVVAGESYVRADLYFATDDPVGPDVNASRLTVGVTDSHMTGVGIANRTVDGHQASVNDGEVIVFDVGGLFDVHASGPEDGEALLAVARTARLVPHSDDQSNWTAEPLK